MSEITLFRTRYSLNGVFGTLFDDHTRIAYTLEHSYSGVPKIPLGIYSCKRSNHILPKLGPIETFEILNVPHHSGILFHPGNSECDSDGCVLLGKEIENNFLLESIKAFNIFMDWLDGQNEFALVIKNQFGG